MALTNDWAANAALEIWMGIVIGAYNSTEDLTEVIRQHAPFEEGSYMPVPRCETCTHWRREVDYYEPKKILDVGLCDAETFIAPVSEHRRDPTMWTECGENTIGTDADFGCVQWKAKQCTFVFSVAIDGVGRRCSLPDQHKTPHEWKMES